MAQQHDADLHDDSHDHVSHAQHAHHGHHAVDERLNAELVADRERIFHNFIRITFWHVVGIAIVLMILAATQT